MRKGYFLYKSPLNLSNIYQFATDNVTLNTTMKRNTCSFDNKFCEKLWIAVYSQSATVTYMPVCRYKTISKTHHTSTKAARRLTTALRHGVSTFQTQAMVYCVVPVTPWADPQRSSMQINNINTHTATNDIIAPDEYARPCCGAYNGFVWVSCWRKSSELWKTSCMHGVSYREHLATGECMLRYL
jgi:hypothetical protein